MQKYFFSAANKNKANRHKFLSAVCREKQLVSSTQIKILESVENLRGMRFFNALIPRLAQAVGADFSFISAVDGDGDKQARTIFACDSASKLHDFSSNAALFLLEQHGKAVNFSQSENAQQFFVNDDSLASGEYQGLYSVLLKNSSGAATAIWVTLFKFRIDDFLGVENLFRSFTGRIAAEIENMEMEKKLQHELKSSETLHRKYKKLATMESKARRQAQSANHAKTSFVANMSHEIKTPLNAILAFSQMLRRSKLSLTQQSQLDNIFNAGHKLSLMLDDVLDLARLEDELDLPQRFERIHEVIDASVDQAADDISQKNIELEYSIDPNVPSELMLSGHYLQKVVMNLLDNAVKFTARGKVRLHISFQRDPESMLTVAVSDSGAGMSESFQKEMLDPFTQEKSSNTREYGGAGIGLHLVDRLISMMGGSLAVESELDKGSTFTVSIPIQCINRASPRSGEHIAATLGILQSEHGGQHLAKVLKYLGVGYCELNSAEAGTIDNMPTCDSVMLDVIKNFPSGSQLEKFLGWAEQSNKPFRALVPRKGISYACKGFLADVPCHSKPLLYRDWQALFEELAREVETTSDEVSKSKKILLVEDNEMNQEIALIILEEGGYDVDVASNGKEALDFLERNGNQYQLILMDIQMPVMDGIEATKYIRNTMNSRIPIVAVSAGLAVQDRLQCDEAGMDDFIPKPMDENFMLRKVDQYMATSM